MKDVQLLDCTLRDGGYINDWEFGNNTLVSVFERLVDSKVDVIEVGFLDDRRPFDINKSIGPNTKSLKKIWGCLNKRPPMVVGMIDFGTCKIENLEPADQSFLDGIRVIFKKQKMYEAMAFCKKVKELGYKVFSQLVSITSYNDDELLELIKLANDVKPYAVSIVDTYGLLQPASLLHYAEVLDQNLNDGIRLGYHAHNNFQMGYANAQVFLSKETSRGLLVDGTLYGMGKSAGNAPLELLAMTMNDLYGKQYNIAPMLEAIEESVLPIYRKTIWGYQKFFYLVAKNKCHPSYLSYFQKKGNLSQTDLDALLARIEPEDKKLLYDADLAETLYQDYVKERFNTDEVITKIYAELKDQKVLLLGPGKNIVLQSEKISEFIKENKPTIISVNYIPDGYGVDYVFLSKASRYNEATIKLHDDHMKVIATSDLTPKNNDFSFVVDKNRLIKNNTIYPDNSFLMILRLLSQAGIREIHCAGFDGYSPEESNYAQPSMEYDFVKGDATVLNRQIQSLLNTEFKDLNIDFITYSEYTNIDDINSGSF